MRSRPHARIVALVLRPRHAALCALALLGCRSPAPGAVSEPPPAADAPTPSGSTTPADDALASTESPSPAPLTRAQLEALVADPGRDPEDRQTDERRAPVDLLLFLGVAPGMRVADIGAGFGYTTELLARAVGPEGTVYGHNAPFVLERFAEAGWSARLSKPVMANVVRLDRPFDDPFPADLQGLDAVINVLFYHDFEWQGVDRAAHNAGVFAALRPGGVYVLVDHSAQEGAGASGSQTLHRIEQSLLQRELEAAGFELVDEADFLRNPADTRDWNALPWRSERQELSDRFVLKFRRPQAPATTGR